MTATKTRKPLTEVHGSCRWVEPLGEYDTAAVLSINGTPYTLYVNEADNGSVLGYQLVKPDGTVYDVNAETWTCDCPDGTYRPHRPQGCKHAKALRAALAQLVKPAAA